MAALIVLDANVLIGHLDESDAHHTAATALLAQNATEDFAASAVTLAEVFVGPARRNDLPTARGAIARLDVKEIAFAGDSAVRLAQLRAATDCRMPDCCVLLAAADANADSVATFDSSLRKAARVRGFGVLPE